MLPAQPLVSIVIPVYNGARYLRESIGSVLAQDYPRIELIVIDDGSTDETPEVLASYGDRIWWVSQPNSRQPAAINRGWRRASGEIAGYLSADDALAPEAVTAAVEALRARGDAIMSYCDFALMDASSQETGRRIMPSGMDLAGILRRGFSPFGPGSFVRRAGPTATLDWDTTLTRVPDFDYSLRLARLGAFVHVPRVLSSFRVHEESISFAAPPDAVTEEAILVVERFYASRDLPPEILAMKGQARAMAHLTAAQGHFRARRVGRALQRCASAAGLFPPVLTTPFAYRLMVSGLIGQFWHRSRSRRVTRRAAARPSIGGARPSPAAPERDGGSSA